MESIVKEELLSLEPSTLIVLFEIVLKNENNTEIGFYRFHSGENNFQKSIFYGGGTGANEYFYLPCTAAGFDFSEGTLPRPVITFDNTDGFFSLKTRYFKDFVGFDVKRIKTFVKFLHDKNFPNNKNPFGTGNEQSYPVENYNINKKSIEDQEKIQFELVSKFEKEGGLVPARRIQYNVCQWQYRSEHGCGYNGGPVADKQDNAWVGSTNQSTIPAYVDGTTYNTGDVVSIEIKNVVHYFSCTKNGITSNPIKDKKSWTQDMCSRSINGCRLRFKNNEQANGLPFGGFPGAFNQ